MTKLPQFAKANTMTWVFVVAVLPPSSVMLIVMVHGPSAGSVWDPLTANWPGPVMVTVPALVVPSPQSMVVDPVPEVK
jgi:hypothetical protein